MPQVRLRLLRWQIAIHTLREGIASLSLLLGLPFLIFLSGKTVRVVFIDILALYHPFPIPILTISLVHFGRGPQMTDYGSGQCARISSIRGAVCSVHVESYQGHPCHLFVLPGLLGTKSGVGTHLQTVVWFQL